MIKSLSSLKRSPVGLALLSTAIMVTGCGSASSTSMSGLLNNIQLTSYTQNGDLWAQLQAQLNTSGFILAGLSVPIVDPNDPSITYGQVSLQSNLCSGSSCTGQGELTIAVDITQVAHVPVTGSDTLPNGTPIPVSGLNNAALVTLPVGSTGAHVYIALGQGVAMLGAALPFQALNGVGQYVPGADIFDTFNMGNVTGLVGMFFGSAANTSGLGIFADLSGVINTGGASTTTSTTASTASSSTATASAQMAVETRRMVEAIQAAPNQLILQPVTTSHRNRNEIDYQLYELSNRHAQLILQ